MGRSRYICQQHETLTQACVCEMDRGGGVLWILPILLSATSNHGPRDNVRGFLIAPDQPSVSQGTHGGPEHSCHQCTMARVAAGIRWRETTALGRSDFERYAQSLVEIQWIYNVRVKAALPGSFSSLTVRRILQMLKACRRPAMYVRYSLRNQYTTLANII